MRLLIFFCFIMSSTSVIIEGCGSTTYTATFGGSCYFKTASSATRANSKTTCESAEGFLVTISSATENTFLLDTFSLGSPPYFWIGLSKSTTGTWQWDVPETSTEGMYMNWATDEPVTNDVNAALGASGWKSWPVPSTRLSAICEKYQTISVTPSLQPTKLPTTGGFPSRLPTFEQTALPSHFPSNLPSPLPTQTPTELITRTPVGLPTFMPTSRPSSSPTSIPSPLPTQIPSTSPSLVPSLFPSSFPTSPPTFSPSNQMYAPEIKISDISSGKYDTKVSLSLSSAGSVYCAAYLTSTSTPVIPTSVSNVMSKQQMISLLTSPYQGTLLISFLYPSSTYSLYCAAVSSSGSYITEYKKMMDSSVSFRTYCCKEVTLTLQSSYYMSNTIVNNAMNLILDSPPTKELKIEISLTSRTNSPPFDNFLFPSVVIITSESTSWSSAIPLSLNNVPPGEYSVILQVSSEEYQAAIFPTASFETLELFIEPPSPKLTLATFNSAGDSLSISFDSLTDRGYFSSYFTSSIQFSCHNFFNFPGVNLAHCEWLDDSTVIISFQYQEDEQSLPIVGDNITLLSNRIRPKCSLSNHTTCELWSTSSSHSLELSSPLNPILPIVILTFPLTLGLCDSPVFDLTGSTGSGGREWNSYEIIATVKGILNNQTENEIYSEQLTKYFQNSFHLTPPSRIPRSLFLDGIVKFQITLCNFLHVCGMATNQVNVNSNPIPSVKILGNKYRTMVSSDTLFIQSKAQNQFCSNDTTTIENTEDLSYEWTINEVETGSPFAYQSISTDPSKLKLMPYVLKVGNTYEISVMITNTFTHQFSSATIQVLIESGTLIPLITGASTQLLQQNISLYIDGSLSYDQNQVTSPQDFIYLWSCYQSYPTLQSLCHLKLTSRHHEVEVFVSNETLIGTKHIVNLQIMRRNSSQISQIIGVELTVIPLFSPLIQIECNQQLKTKQKSSLLVVNAADQLILTGIVKLTGIINNGTTATWAINDPTIDLIKSSLSPIQRDLSSNVNNLNLIIIPYSLVGRSTPYIFTLIVDDVTSSFNVYVNPSPSQGNFLISPVSGYELNTTFTLSAAYFIDDDLPLTYQFSYEILPEISLILQSRSELTSSSSVLPSGQDNQNWILSCELLVFDDLDASIFITREIQVIGFESSLTLISPQYSKSETDVDSVHSTIDLNGAVLNFVTCLSAPHCISLNRYNCSLIANTCGKCFEGFFGVFGDDNSMCIPQNMTTSSQASLDCTTSSDCDLWFQCLNNTCVKSLQSCSMPTCSGHGECLFLNIQTDQFLSQCFLGDSNCQAKCVCHDEYFGSICDEFVDQMSLKDLQIQELLNLTLEWIEIDIVTEDRLISWIHTLYALSLSSNYLSIENTYHIFNITLLLLEKSASVNLYYTDLLTLYSILDQTVTILYHDNNFMLDETLKTWDQVSTSLIRSMSTDQPNMQSIFDLLRINNIVTELDASQQQEPVSIIVPQTDLESFNQVIPSSCQITPVDVELAPITSVSRYSLTSFPSKLQNNSFNVSTPLISNSLRLLFYNSTGAPVNPINRDITFILQHNQEILQPVETNETFMTTCSIGSVTISSHVCYYTNSSFNYTLYHSCNGTFAYILTSRCPQPSFKTSCSQFTTKSSLYKCEVIKQTSWNTTCLCRSNELSSSRYLTRGYKTSINTNSNEDEDEDDEDDDDDESKYTLEVGVTVHSQLIEFSQTWTKTSQEYNSLEDVEDTILIIVMYGSLWFVGFVGLLYCLFQKRKREHAKSLETKVRKCGVKTIKKISSMESENFLLKYINSIFPVVFHEKPYWARLYSECVTQHRYLIPFFTHGDNSENIRMLTVVNVLTVQSMLMFILAVLYDTEYPNHDNSCTSLDNKIDCLKEESASLNICEWKYQSNSNQFACVYVEPDANIQTMIMFSIAVSILTAPINLIVDFLFLDILAAPTFHSLKKTEKDETKIKISVGLQRDHKNSSHQNEHQTSRRYFQWFFKETRILPPQTREAQFIASLTSRNIVEEIWKKYEVTKEEKKRREGNQKEENEIELPLKKIPSNCEIEKLESQLLFRSKTSSLQTDCDSKTSSIPPRSSSSSFSSSSDVNDVNDSNVNSDEKKFEQFLHDLKLQREKLSFEQLEVFDQCWCIDENCNFKDLNHQILPCLPHSCSSQSRSRHPNEIMKLEITNVINKVSKCHEKLKKYDTSSIGIEILHLFAVDLLGRDTSCAQIFKHKVENDFRRSRVVSKYLKLLAWVLVLILNILFIYFSLLRGLERGFKWQRYYVVACMIQFILEIFVYETSECIILQFLIPNTAKAEISAVMTLFCSLINQICQHIDIKTPDEIILNSSHYFFISTNLALLFPNLFESAVVSSFRSYLPGPIGMKWNHTYTSTKQDQGMNFWITLHLTYTQLIQHLASLPPLFQRLIVHSLQPLLVAFVVIVWVKLIQHPIYFLTLLGLIILLTLFKMMNQHLNQLIKEKNSLESSLEIVTKQNVEIVTNASLENRSIHWATTSNPINSPHLSTRQKKQSSKYPEIEMEMEIEVEVDDEESCIEMIQTVS